MINVIVTNDFIQTISCSLTRVRKIQEGFMLHLRYRGYTVICYNRRSLEEVDHNTELKQQRRRRLRKRHVKSEFALLQTLSRLFLLVQFVKCWQIFVEFNFKRLYQSSGKKIKSLSCIHVLDET